MPYLLRKPLIVCATIFVVSNAHAQFITRSVVASAGETYTSPTATMNFVAGETVDGLLTNPQANPNLYVTTGFEQPDIEVSQVLASSHISLALFPNPSNASVVKLAFNHVPDGVYTINVFSEMGRILQSQTFNYKATNDYYFPLDASQLPAGIYFVQVVNPALFTGEVKMIKY